MRLDIIPFVLARKNFSFAAGVLSLSGLLLSGCARPTSLPRKAPAVRAGQLPIITVIAGGRESYWLQAKAGAVAAGKKLGAQIVWKVPVGNDLVASQKKLMQDATTNSHGIVLAPTDSTKLMQPVGDAALAGLAVVVFDRDVFTLQNKLSYVHTDEYQTGVLAAQQVGKLIGQSSKVFICDWAVQPTVQERVQGFEATVQKQYPNFTVTKSEEENVPPDTAAVFAPYDNAVFQIMSRPKTSAQIIACGSFYEPLLEELQRGQIAALISPDYYQMGFQSVKAIIDYRALKYPPREIKIAPRVITKSTKSNNHGSTR